MTKGTFVSGNHLVIVITKNNTTLVVYKRNGVNAVILILITIPP